MSTPADATTTARAVPSSFHVLGKPTGAICNLDCSYCFFLAKEELYPGSTFRMSDDLLETYLRQLLEGHRDPEVTISWQGGEPTLMGIDFFRRVVELVERLRRPDQVVEHAIQTNGTLVDDAWGAFFAQHDVLVGISIDGPRELPRRLPRRQGRQADVRPRDGGPRPAQGARRPVERPHDRASRERGARPRGLPLPARRPRCASSSSSSRSSSLPAPGDIPTGSVVTDRSVSPAGYGRFLVDVFDEWVRRDVGRVYVQMFDSTLASFVGVSGALCVHAETCGTALALEHNGDLYSCDHFVEPEHLLGNITLLPLVELVSSAQQKAFGDAKRDSLPAYCRACDVRFACNGGCPKDRFTTTPDGEAGLHYLCKSYQTFFRHVDAPMRVMAAALRSGGYADSVMAWTAQRDARTQASVQERVHGQVPGSA